jgi:Ribonucleotide reductase inhibitor
MESITKRRRFQAPITNFFDSNCDDDSTTRNTSNSSSAFPTLPASTQSSLLTVGCRIRKSVPEGYKTHATASGGFTPRPFMPSRLSPTTLAAITAPAKYSELTPYASDSRPSIHDVGGLPAIQPLPLATFCGVSLHHMPSSSSLYSSPSSSQESIIANTNKRAFDDSLSSSSEDDDVDSDFIPQLPPSVFSGYLSSSHHPQPSSTPFTSHHRRGSSYPFKHTTMPDLNALSASNVAHRAFAQPKSRRKPQPLPPASPEQENFGFFGRCRSGWNTYDAGLESASGSMAFGGCGYEMNLESTSGGMDFGEAGFLRRRDEVEMDCS